MNAMAVDAFAMYLCIRFEENSPGILKTEIRNILTRFYGGNNGIKDNEKLTARILVETGRKHGLRQTPNFNYSVLNLSESVCTASEAIESAVEKIIEIFTETETAAENGKSFREQVREKLKQLHDSQLRNIRVDDFAGSMGYSRSYFTVRVRKETGKTPHQLIMSEKLCRAMLCLAGKNGNMTVTDISQHLGFSSPKYFRRVFREAFGFCPSGFRCRTKIPRLDASEINNLR
ncbi:MAG: helix-turn-helix transcriptional regulator [Acidobacteria bacterium]|nr:helix-turn-helix transcriptional regulator [Acidobacteriota bacterium]